MTVCWARRFSSRARCSSSRAATIWAFSSCASRDSGASASASSTWLSAAEKSSSSKQDSGALDLGRDEAIDLTLALAFLACAEQILSELHGAGVSGDCAPGLIDGLRRGSELAFRQGPSCLREPLLDLPFVERGARARRRGLALRAPAGPARSRSHRRQHGLEILHLECLAGRGHVLGDLALPLELEALEAAARIAGRDPGRLARLAGRRDRRVPSLPMPDRCRCPQSRGRGARRRYPSGCRSVRWRFDERGARDPPADPR